MKVVIFGDERINDIAVVDEAVKKSKFPISEVVICEDKGIGAAAKNWAIAKNITFNLYSPNWSDTNVEGALVRVNNWGKPYNAKAGFMRDEEVASYVDGGILIQPKGDCNNAANLRKELKSEGASLFEYPDKKTRYTYDLANY